MGSHHAYLYLSRERVEMLLGLSIPDDELVKTLKHHLNRFDEEQWMTLRCRFSLRSSHNHNKEEVRNILHWCRENFGDNNIIDRRWYIVSNHKTIYYRHLVFAFKYAADQTMFKMTWNDVLWVAPKKEGG